MMKFEVERVAYNVLKEVYVSGAYVSIALPRALALANPTARPKITALVYGVIEKEKKIDYIISSLTKSVKNNVAILLKMGVYELIEGSEPEYAVVKRYVDFAKDRLFGTQGFVNAVLRKVGQVRMPTDDDSALSLSSGLPEWAIDIIKKDFGEEGKKIITAELPKRAHIRRNARITTADEFEKKISTLGEYTPTPFGYFVSASIMDGLDEKEFTRQSLASTIATNFYAQGMSGKVKVLDVCSAPGGKAVYIGELLPQAEVIACDVREHRVNLIRSYARRMGADMTVLLRDGREYDEKWSEAFDLVIVDAPCTGSGVAIGSPDVLRNKKASDVETLRALQLEILTVSSKYVRAGGYLAYSTCSVFKRENEEVVREFLSGGDFTLVSEKRLFPHVDGADGFYMAKMRKQV